MQLPAPAASHSEAVRWRRYVALGDSFTEGMNDLGPDGRLRGWADRLAESIDERQPGLRYANLAVRGAKVSDVVSRQLPTAIALRPDLTTVAVGVNDMLRPRFSLSAAVMGVESTVAAMRTIGSDVLLVAFGDPRRRSRALGSIADRIRHYDDHLHRIADRFDARIVDYWGAQCFDDDRLWSPDRLHLSSLGHEYAARAGLDALGLGDPTWRLPLPDTLPAAPFLHRRLDDARWLVRDVTPWATRRILRKSYPQLPRRPELEPLSDRGR